MTGQIHGVFGVELLPWGLVAGLVGPVADLRDVFLLGLRGSIGEDPKWREEYLWADPECGMATIRRKMGHSCSAHGFSRYNLHNCPLNKVNHVSLQHTLNPQGLRCAVRARHDHKEAAMPVESGVGWVAAEQVPLPPMLFAETFHWDGVGPMVRAGAPMTRAQYTRSTMRTIAGWRDGDRPAASTNTMSRFETEDLTQKKNLEGLAHMNTQWVDRAMARTTHRRVILDMDSSEGPVYGEQEGAAYNGHFQSVCYHSLFLFNQFGDCEEAMLRPGNVHSADRWREVLEPVVDRYWRRGMRQLFRGDAAFAKPELYQFLEAHGVGYAIRDVADCGSLCLSRQGSRSGPSV
jgi:hypothetical protein